MEPKNPLHNILPSLRCIKKPWACERPAAAELNFPRGLECLSPVPICIGRLRGLRDARWSETGEFFS